MTILCTWHANVCTSLASEFCISTWSDVFGFCEFGGWATRGQRRQVRSSVTGHHECLVILRNLLPCRALVRSGSINLTISNETQDSAAWTSLVVSHCGAGLEKETILH